MLHDPDRVPQRRIYVTPTLKRIAPLEIEQSNSFLRQLKQFLEYMVRINIVTETMKVEFYANPATANLLESFVEPAITAIDFCGIQLKFLNYTASQIKQKSWWQYVDNHGFLEYEEY